eukprot:m.170519 g.170519  ORF g.170519 m.170519 type:complete len:376 (-) comp15276_c5_seq1:34-1161(-)
MSEKMSMGRVESGRDLMLSSIDARRMLSITSLCAACSCCRAASAFSRSATSWASSSASRSSRRLYSSLLVMSSSTSSGVNSRFFSSAGLSLLLSLAPAPAPAATIEPTPSTSTSTRPLSSLVSSDMATSASALLAAVGSPPGTPPPASADESTAVRMRSSTASASGSVSMRNSITSLLSQAFAAPIAAEPVARASGKAVLRTTLPNMNKMSLEVPATATLAQALHLLASRYHLPGPIVSVCKLGESEPLSGDLPMSVLSETELYLQMSKRLFVSFPDGGKITIAIGPTMTLKQALQPSYSKRGLNFYDHPPLLLRRDRRDRRAGTAAVPLDISHRAIDYAGMDIRVDVPDTPGPLPTRGSMFMSTTADGDSISFV